MKKHYLLNLIVGVLLTIGGFAQTSEVTIENWCGTAKRMNDMQANPEKSAVLANDELIRQQEALQPQSGQRGVIYKIPVVFHILHNGGPENISEEQIYNAFDVINRDFRAQNEDTSDVIALFKPIIGDAEIELALATRAPNGACFRGYTRTQSPLTSQGDDGDAQVDAIRNGNDVFQGNWPSNEYLNVFVIDDAGGAGGYTNYPSNWNLGDMSNGIWILNTQFGEIGTSGLSGGRSMTHEIGHWLNLPHTWGSSNTPGEPENCSMDDGVSDTPLCSGATGGCPVTQNTCGPVANVQNYMDYALSCQSMFTLGQVDRMRLAIQSSVGGRNNLWTPENLAATGADELVLCKADFEAAKTTVCAGDDVQFTDMTFNAVSGWEWSFPGGSPASSIEQNPIVSYALPGVYEVTLVASDGSFEETETKTAYITVLDAPATLPFLDGFEDYSSLIGINEWVVNNPGNNAGWEITTNASHSGAKSARLLNFGQVEGNIDELIAASVDLSESVTTNLAISFRYAYKKRTSGDYEKMFVHISTDCGDTWIQRKVLAGNALGSEISNSTFVPTAADWVTVHITNFSESHLVENFRYRFRFESDGGNNVYLDNINIYNGAPSEELVVGLTENELLKDVTVYPNPTENELNVQFSLENSQTLVYAITDITGKTVQSSIVHAAVGNNLITSDMSELANGMYLIQLSGEGIQQTIQFVKK